MDFSNIKQLKKLLKPIDEISEESFAEAVIQQTETTAQSTNEVSAIFGLNAASAQKYFNCLDIDEYDIEIFEDFLKTSVDLKQLYENGIMQYPVFKYILQDIFFGLYKYNIKLRQLSDMHVSCKGNHILLSNIFNKKEFLYLRINCKLNEYNTIAATIEVGQLILGSILESMQQIDDLADQVQAMDRLIDLESIYQIADQMTNSQLSQILQGIQSDVSISGDGLSKEEIQTLADLQAQLCDDILMSQNDVDDLIASENVIQGFSSVQDALEKSTELAEIWGFENGTNGVNYISYDSKKNALEYIRNSKRLYEMTELIGRMKNAAKQLKKSSGKHAGVEIKDVTIGDSIPNALPSELMLMGNESTKNCFFQKMSDKQLLNYKKIDSSSKYKGPLIYNIDTSGSMHGEKEMWSKALTLASLEIAKEQHRDFAAIMYGSHADSPIIVEKNEFDPNKIIMIAERFSGGGTNFEPPLRESIRMIENSKVFKNADIMFITDGQSSVSKTFLEELQKKKEHLEFEIHGVLIDLGGKRRNSYSENLKLFCDDITYLSEITDECTNNLLQLIRRDDTND